ncbi:MAG: discoidin domain-containing protein [Bacteroidota bacterium]|nr:discoidin domain-containing protein [Bacteroidota bacterium]
MNNRIRKTEALFVLLALSLTAVIAQQRTLETFGEATGWSYNISDGVTLKTSTEKGVTGNAIRIDYDFTEGTGFGGIQKFYAIDLPENYEFTFWLKAESPSNNFEIKFIDSTGNNVWWVNNRNFDFPREWTKVRIKRRHISFAWGPTEERELKRVDRIEFTVASFVGGKGTLWLDELKFEPLPPETDNWPEPLVSATSSAGKHLPAFATDGTDDTFWQSKKGGRQIVTFDFRGRREFGGLQIRWLEGSHAASYDVQLSSDGKNWENAYSAGLNRSDVSFIRLPEAEAAFMRLVLNATCNGRNYGIREVVIPGVRSTLTPNDFIIYAAKNSPEGNYPAYFSERASSWTVTGVSSDTKEALLSEDGTVEVEKARFSIEPVIKVGETVVSHAVVKPVQGMGFPGLSGGFVFLPSVEWKHDGIRFVTGVSSGGTANSSSMLNIGYYFENTTEKPVDFEFYLLVRPFQVNPYYQFLNTVGGVGKIVSASERGKGLIDIDGKVIRLTGEYESFGAAKFDEGNIVEMIRRGEMPEGKSAEDASGMASGVIKYRMHLEPGQSRDLYASIPYHGNLGGVPGEASEVDRIMTSPTTGSGNLPGQETRTGAGAGTAGIPFLPLSADKARELFVAPTEYWEKRTGHIMFDLPPSADRLINTWRSNLAYILINRDNAGIQPGSRSYDRSWIRDGSLTSSALLKSGIVTEVREFIEWYAANQYENGKVPCVVDFRGPDPVPEHDSHGQLIYLIREYFNFTGDTAFLRSMNPHVLKAVDYIGSIVAERSTDHFRNGNDSIRAYYGLVPESISHEGYSAKPMHSYWDNFFTMKGLKDAVEIQAILGENENRERISRMRDEFRKNLYSSIDLAMKVRGIDYIPGCVELGDFDATSTTIALTPCNELGNLPVPQVYNTFEKYYDFFKKRRDGLIEWINYTPYENRLIGSFIMLDQPDRAHELIDFLLNDQRPHGWNHWAEVVWKDPRYPGFIGDMPHTWCGSDFINAVRSMFVYENEYDHTLVLAAGLYQDWIDAPGGMSVGNLPTYYGDISYSIVREGNSYRFTITGDLDLPEGGIRIKNFSGGEVPAGVTVNGREISGFSGREISVPEVPAVVVISY